MWTWASIIACAVFVIVFEIQDTWGDKLFTTGLAVALFYIMFH